MLVFIMPLTLAVNCVINRLDPPPTPSLLLLYGVNALFMTRFLLLPDTKRASYGHKRERERERPELLSIGGQASVSFS